MSIRWQQLEPSRGGEEINGVIGCELLSELDELCWLELVLWHTYITSFPHSTILLAGLPAAGLGTGGASREHRVCPLDALLGTHDHRPLSSEECEWWPPLPAHHTKICTSILVFAEQRKSPHSP